MKESITFIDDREDDELNDVDVNETEEDIINNIKEISDKAKKRHIKENNKNIIQTIKKLFETKDNSTQ